jgi:hypothetical protein
MDRTRFLPIIPLGSIHHNLLYFLYSCIELSRYVAQSQASNRYRNKEFGLHLSSRNLSISTQHER